MNSATENVPVTGSESKTFVRTAGPIVVKAE